MAYGNLAVETITASTGQIIGASSSATMKNRIINGDMRIDQRNSGGQITSASNTYTVDRFLIQGSQTGKFNVQQVADAPAGFVYSLKATVGTAVSVASSDYFILRQPLEGYTVADLDFGLSTAKTVTVSFWVKSSLIGLHSGHLTNSSSARWYAFTYGINQANTWEYKTATIPGDTTGSWAKDNSVGIYLGWSLGTGVSNQAAGSNAWSSSTGIGAPSEVNTVATSGATLQITGVQFEVGASATSFDYRHYTKELQLCQRYYQLIGDGTLIASGYLTSGNYLDAMLRFPVIMRASPSVSINGTWNVSGNNGQPTISLSGASGVSLRVTATSTGQVYATVSGGSGTPTFSANAELS